MIDPNQQPVSISKERLLAFSTMIAQPIVYFIMTFLFKNKPMAPDGVNDMVLYILLIVAAVEPSFYLLIRRVQQSMFKRTDFTAASPEQLYRTLVIIRSAMVVGGYVMGMVVFFLTFDVERLLLFYPAGIIWTLIYWPRVSEKKQFLEELSRP